jgi:hypothetical protein
MLTVKKPLVLAGLAAGLVALCGTSRASSITQIFNIPTTAAPFTAPFTYNLFDSNLGMLTSVTLQLATTSTAEVDVFDTNPLGTDEPFTDATASFHLTVTGPPGAMNYITDTITAGPISGTAAGPFLNETKFPGVTGTDNSGLIQVLSPNWPVNYEAPGGGTAGSALVFSVGAGTFGGTATDVAFSGSGTVGGTLTLVYNYLPPATPGTPEPGTWALLFASASVSVAGLRRRRAAKAA